MMNDKAFDRLDKQITDLNQEMVTFNEAQAEKHSTLKEHIKEIEQKLNKDFVTSDKLIYYDQKMKELKSGY